MRYYVEMELDGEKSEVGGQRKKTKKEIESWITDNVAASGLDWRVGFTVKFRNSKAVYTWKKLKDHRLVPYS